ncbi:MAG: phospholipase D-like domain-containing protein [Candidatus Gastranaerophilales bacterium]
MKMKKFLIASLICLITQASTIAAEQETYKVLKVIDGDTMYIDFNRDGYYQKDEKVRINGIDTFEVKPSYWLDNQMKQFNFTQTEALGLGYYGKEFAKKNLLDKEVIVKRTAEIPDDTFNRGLVSIYFTDGRNYEQEVLKSGLATVYEKSNLAPQLKEYENLDKVYKNSEKARKLDLVLLNKKNGKYHKPTCKYGQMASNAELIQKPNFLSEYKPASCVKNNMAFDVNSDYIKPENLIYRHKEKAEEIKKLISSNYIEPNSNIDIFLIYPSKQRTLKGETTQAGKELAKMINETKSTLDLALFGFENQPEIYNALINAQKRGVQVRVVFDMNYKGNNTYYRTIDVINSLENGTVRTDYLIDYNAKSNNDKIPGALMHNKYVISDMQKVWTGSANVSDTCTGGYNANISGIITSKIVAWLYTRDFEYMYVDKKFHQNKPETYLQNIKLADGSELQVFFLPGLSANKLGLIPMMNNAKDYLYGLTFFYTNNKLISSLIEAHSRNVDTKEIIDAVEANAIHRKKHYLLRKAGVLVKSENFGGKMHCKTFLADDEIFSFGSMNATTTAEYYNDENLVIVKNPKFTKQIKEYFNTLWQSIPDQWLYADPQPEGPDSPGSCSDGIDNDHDGKRDMGDVKCNYELNPAYK